MRSGRLIGVLWMVCVCVGLCGCAEETRSAKASGAASGWRSLQLVNASKIDPAWTHVGWGGFVVEDGMLKTAPDERGLGMLLYKKEKLGDCQIRVVFKSD